MAVVADEAEETEGWLELLKQADEASGPELDWLINESRELRAIFVQSVKTARLNYQRSRGSDAVDPQIPRSPDSVIHRTYPFLVRTL